MTRAPVRHRLAAILAADVAGYSRLMADDDRATVETLDAARRVFRARIEEHHGRVVDMAGDSVLAVFDAVVGAVTAALAIQREINASADATREDRQMRFRVGVHLGDVIEKADGTVYGDGVNIAARLEGLAQPGGITISDSVRIAVRGKVPAAFDDEGEQRVKNIPDPVRAWRVRSEVTEDREAAPTLDVDPAVRDQASIAVLAFTNMSGDPEQEYFSDGISEDIITDLSKIAGLMVVARNSSFAYKSKSVDLRTVGRELGVKSVLEGSIRRAGNRVRINAQLIDATTGGHLWAERYDREITDIFALQDEVTQHIVEALRIRLGPSVHTPATGRTRNVEAHDCFLRGRELLMSANKDREQFERTVALLSRAIALDPGYADPHAGLALAHCHDFQNGWSDTPNPLDVAARFAEQAIEKGPHEPYPHVIASIIAFWQHDLRRCLAEADLALALNPNQAQASGMRGLAAIYRGHPLDAVPHIERAIRLDPATRQQSLHFLGSAYLVAGDYAAAEATFRERIRLAPSTDLTRAFLASALGHLGKIAEARSVWQELRQINPSYSLSEHLARLPFQNEADRDRIRDGLADVVTD